MDGLECEHHWVVARDGDVQDLLCFLCWKSAIRFNIRPKGRI